jgi:hypothetical protein
LLDWLWQGPQRAEISPNGRVAAISGAGALEMPPLASLWHARGGFSLDFRARFDDLTPHQSLFDSRDECGNGITIWLTERATLKITLSGTLNSPIRKNGDAEMSWECDAGRLKAGKWHSFTAIVDGGPKVLLWVVDGQLCDGGTERPFGWGRFHSDLDNVNGAARARVAASLRGELAAFRLYNRALFVNEAAANHRALESR